jgi:AbrB family looped-hinge helix DNA binding protein
MNAQSKIEFETTVNMTSKGQVLIPKNIRDRMGLKPNGPVRVGLNDRGETVVLPAMPKESETLDQRKQRIRAALEAARGSISLGGMSTDEYMQWLRGDREP